MQYYKDIENFVKGKKVFCGIDVHLKFWIVCFYCDGEVVESTRIDFGYSQLLTLLGRYDGCREMSIVYEAGFIGFSLYRNLSAAGYNCIITPPVLIPRSGSKVKTDKRDAQKLASYLAAGLLKEVYIPPAEVESDRGVIRRRAQLVKNQTRCKSQIKSFLYLRGLTRPKGIKKHWSNAYLNWLEELEFSSASDRFTFSQLIKSYRRVREDIVEVTTYLKTLSKDSGYSHDYQRLCRVKGIGLITAMTYILEIYDFARFPKSTEFSSFLGFTPLSIPAENMFAWAVSVDRVMLISAKF